MELQGLLNLQLMMFLLMGVGAALRRMNIVTREGRGLLTDLIVDVFLPCNIIASFTSSFDREALSVGLEVVVISVVLQVFCIGLSAFCYRRVPKPQRSILQYGTVCSNAAFLGNPVAEGLFGSLGLLYASLYAIPQRIVMWSVGVSYFTDHPSKREVLKKVVTHPCILSVAIGLVLMITDLPLPAFLSKSISTLGGCTTAVTMLFIGAVLAEAGLRHMVCKLTVIYAAVRLLGIPLAVLAGCLLCHVDATAASLSVVLAAMPAGSTTAIMAAKYQGDEVFATRCVVFTTLLSMALLPLWCLALNGIYGI